jgi:hypothetical protein
MLSCDALRQSTDNPEYLAANKQTVLTGVAVCGSNVDDWTSARMAVSTTT